jgi:hypothetical protein
MRKRKRSTLFQMGFDPKQRYRKGFATMMSYGKRLDDIDRDGVPNWKDCQPLNPWRQDWPGESERHSEAAKLGWTMRKFGWKRDDVPGIRYSKKKSESIVGISGSKNKWYVQTWGSFRPVKNYGPYKSKEDAENALITMIIIGEA